MEIKININKVHFVIIIALIVVLGFVIAQGTPNPGHDAGEIGSGSFPGNEYTIPGGHLGVGVSTVANSEGWERVVHLYSPSTSRFSVGTSVIDGRIMTHNTGWWGAPAGMIIGTGTGHSLSFATGSQKRMEIQSSGDVDVTGTLWTGNVVSGGRQVCRDEGTFCPPGLVVGGGATDQSYQCIGSELWGQATCSGGQFGGGVIVCGQGTLRQTGDSVGGVINYALCIT
jgi:hypothetical protein